MKDDIKSLENEIRQLRSNPALWEEDEDGPISRQIRTLKAKIIKLRGAGRQHDINTCGCQGCTMSRW